ncbi:MAG TPA: hypothetical protein VHZ81_01095 [Galbitalea sp.]|nr:hypothetical protein [Galbitalea sp.]
MTGVSRRTFFVLFGLVVLALIALAIALFAGAFGVHGTNASSVGAIGPRGATGAQGPAGPSGSPGPSGAPGTPGANGAGNSTATRPKTIAAGGGTYHVHNSDLVSSMIEIPTSNVSGGSTTIASPYLAATAPVYNTKNVKVGEFSATFLSMQTADGIFTTITNSFTTTSGLVVTWSTPTKVSNLELDTLTKALATQKTVDVTTQAGSATFYGDTFNLAVSASNSTVTFRFNAAT